MDARKRAGLLLMLANLGWSVLTVAVGAGIAVTAFLALGWADVLAYTVFGAIAGAALGSVRDSRIFQALLGVTGIVLLSFALYWSGGQSMPAEALPLVGSGLIAFATLATLTRIWGRSPRESDSPLADLDAAVTRPRMG